MKSYFDYIITFFMNGGIFTQNLTLSHNKSRMEAMTILLSSKIIEELITDYYWYIVIQSSFNPKIYDLGTGFNGLTVTKWSNSVTVFFSFIFRRTPGGELEHGLSLVYHTSAHADWIARGWLAKYYSPLTLKQVKLLVGPLVIQLVWYILSESGGYLPGRFVAR